MKSTFALALLTLAATMPLFQPAAVNTSYSVSVTIRPLQPRSPYQLLATSRTPPPHSCDVVITDLTSHKTIKPIHLMLMPGDTATKTAYNAGAEIFVNASLSAKAERAQWEVTVRRNGEILMSQKSDTQLRVTPATER